MSKHAKKPHHSTGTSKEVKKPHRSTGMTIVLILVVLGNLIMTGVYWVTVRQEGDPSLALWLLLLSSAAGVISALGIWNWQRWGLILYLISAAVTAVVALVLTGDLIMVFGAVLIPIIVLYFLRPHYGDFT